MISGFWFLFIFVTLNPRCGISFIIPSRIFFISFYFSRGPPFYWKKSIERMVNERICKLSDDEILQGIYVKEEMDSWMKKVDLKYAKEEGKKEANMETARKLLKENVSIDVIIKTTDITKEQIETLK